MEGDNHEDTTDSNDFGPVAFEDLRGKVTSVLWPLSRMGPTHCRLTADSERRLTKRFEEEGEDDDVDSRHVFRDIPLWAL